MDNRPIGVFDSGLGGLTAVRELRALLPGEDIIYFGDTGRVPYGGRSRETILRYAMQDANLLLGKDVKAVLSACGTVSAVAGEQLLEYCPCPYLEAVTPAARRAADLSVTGRIGVVATRATIASGRFQEAVRQALPAAELFAIPCPLFVPLVEEGHFAPDDELVQQVVRLYLGAMRRQNVDTLILGCTHYPLLAEAITIYMGKEVVLVDSGREAAKATAAQLDARGLLSGRSQGGGCRYYVTDAANSFAQTAALFMGEPTEGAVEQVSLESLEAVSTPMSKDRSYEGLEHNHEKRRDDKD